MPKRFGVKEVAFDKTYSLWQLTYLYGFHFISLVAIVVIMVIGFTPIMAVFWSTVITFAVSFIRKDTALTPRKLVKALARRFHRSFERGGHLCRRRNHCGSRDPDRSWD